MKERPITEKARARRVWLTRGRCSASEKNDADPSIDFPAALQPVQPFGKRRRLGCHPHPGLSDPAADSHRLRRGRSNQRLARAHRRQPGRAQQGHLGLDSPDRRRAETAAVLCGAIDEQHRHRRCHPRGSGGQQRQGDQCVAGRMRAERPLLRHDLHSRPPSRTARPSPSPPATAVPRNAEAISPTKAIRRFRRTRSRRAAPR